jgi:pimeloyl-ACP methyl ester carboxylesterase
MSKPIKLILLHGIRDYGTSWMIQLKALLQANNIEVVPITYTRVSAFFLSMPSWVRRKHESTVRSKLSRLITDLSAENEVIVFAHSYGTYLFAHTLAENPMLRLSRAILFGSILRQDFDWLKVYQCFSVSTAGKNIPVLNCCGNRDFWPVFAQHLDADYGPAGSRGFNNGRVRDFFFEGDHGTLLTPALAADSWIPYCINGTLPTHDSAVPGEHSGAEVIGSIIGFIWRTLRLRQVFGLCYFPKIVLPIVLVLSLIIYFIFFKEQSCHDRSDLTIENFITKFDQSLESPAGYREFQANFINSCWHVKWRVEIVSGSNPMDKEQHVIVKPEKAMPGIKNVDIPNLQIYCDFKSGNNWKPYQVSDVVVIEGDVFQLREKQIMLRNCRISKP